MVQFNTWCDESALAIRGHTLSVMSARAADLEQGCAAMAAALPVHYAAEEQVARVLRRLGRPAAAAHLEGKLPTTKSIRSGDLGEILATEYIGDQTPFSVPVKRLRWKDHRNMAMRGDDVIGLRFEAGDGQLRFLKTEAKSRGALGAGVVADARAALDKDGGLPSAHALAFISARLFEAGETDLADAIDDAQLNTGVPTASVTHLLFTFSGNDPTGHLGACLQTYAGPVAQRYAGVRIEGHGDFVGAVYDLVIANAQHD
jgi:hypothetical protein